MKLNYGGMRALNKIVMVKTMFFQIIYPWIDLLWIPVSMMLVERSKWILTSLFILACVLLLRLQLELFGSIGFKNGFFGLLKSGAYDRGLVVYGVFIALFLFLAYFSKGGDKNVHMAASITILIMSFCVSSVIMVL